MPPERMPANKRRLRKGNQPGNERAIKDAAGKFLPVFIFHGLKEARADTRRSADLLERDFAHLPLALQAFAKRTLGHGNRAGRVSEAGAGLADPAELAECDYRRER